MNLYVILSFLLLGVAAFVVQKKRRFNQIDILHLLFVAAVAVLLKSDFEDQQSANVWTYGLIAMLAVNFLLSRWSKLRKPFLRLIPPILTFGVFIALFWNDSFIYLGKNFNISDKATMVLPILGIVTYEMAHVSMSFLQRYFGMKNSAENMLMSFLIGIAALVGAFNAQGYGVFLVAAGFTAASFYNNIGSKHILHSLLAVSLLWLFAEANELQIIDLRFPKVVGGLFIGAFASLLIQQVWTIERKPNLALIFSYILVALLFMGMIDFGTRLHPSFGGMEAFLGGLIGFAIANSVLYFHERKEHLRQAPIMMSGLTLIMLIGMILPTMYVNEEAEAILKTLEVQTEKNEEGEEVKVAYISFEDLSGKYDVVSEESVISFKLGPAGSVTKGAIKNFTGNFNFSDDLTQSTFDIKLPVLNLTTFIPMRDKSIMDETYFNEAKFPLMRFKGSQLKVNKTEDGYEMVGQFEMLGVKKDLEVRLHRVEEEGEIVLVGNGELDRRDFGMSDDPREGNIVEFEFKVQLKN